MTANKHQEKQLYCTNQLQNITQFTDINIIIKPNLLCIIILINSIITLFKTDR